jgi:D-alanyl-lipoteichoic acid acyltransferase DltB (MBOAT superfamily)
LGDRVRAALGERGTRTDASRAWVRAAVVANLAVLGYFKYLGFFGDLVGADWHDILLPIGLSFIVFQAMGYVIDIGRGVDARLRLVDFAVYLTFFAHVLAGPIVRATEFGPQIAERPDPRRVEFAEAFQLIFRGLVKKVVISSYLASEIVDPVFANPELYGRWSLLFGVYGFAVQIYCDFSGYTDIAIGCALLLGIRFPQNFDAPYIARSVQDFWRRWHMTLSRWLRDYLYIPLGGNREGELRTLLNLFLTMLIGGFWHGASWTMVAWGAIHGVALVAERELRARWTPLGLPEPVVSVLQWLATFHVVCLAWIFFRAESFEAAITIIGGIFTPAGPVLVAAALAALAVLLARGFQQRAARSGERVLGQAMTGAVLGAGFALALATLVGGLGEIVGDDQVVHQLVLAAIAFSLATQFVPPGAVDRVQHLLGRVSPWAISVGIGVAFLFIDGMGPEGVPEFIYFQF